MHIKPDMPVSPVAPIESDSGDREGILVKTSNLFYLKIMMVYCVSETRVKSAGIHL